MNSFFKEIELISNRVKANLTSKVLDEIDLIMKVEEEFLIYSLRECESPIEQLFCLRLIKDFPHYESVFRATDSGVNVRIFVQKEVDCRGKKYRPDFIIECDALGKEHKFVIECDGHNFHEKTKKQAQRDKSRERDLQNLGFRVIRFSGSEIWKNAKQCVSQTFSIIQNTTGLFEKLMEDMESENL